MASSWNSVPLLRASGSHRTLLFLRSRMTRYRNTSDRHSEIMTIRKFRSGAFSHALRDAASFHITIMSERQNKYGVTLFRMSLRLFICFSGAEKFPVIFSAVLTLWFFRVKTKEQESIVCRKYHKAILHVADSSPCLPISRSPRPLSLILATIRSNLPHLVWPANFR